MKYSIHINQIALQEIDKNLDIKDGAILDYLIAFCSADDKKIDQIDTQEGGQSYRYTWIDYSHLIKEMPLLGFNTTNAVYLRMRKLKNSGFIKTKVLSSEKTGQRKLYVRLTEKIKLLSFKVPYHPEVISLSLGDREAYHPEVIEHSIKEHSIKEHSRLDKPTLRKSKTFLKEDYKFILDKYQELKGITLKSKEFDAPMQDIKSMFLSDRKKDEIISFMEWLAEKASSGEKEFIWTTNWTIKTVRLKLPEFLAGKFSGGEVETPSYAKSWQK